MPYIRCPECYTSSRFTKKDINTATCTDCGFDLYDYYDQGRDEKLADAMIRSENKRLKKKIIKNKETEKTITWSELFDVIVDNLMNAIVFFGLGAYFLFFSIIGLDDFRLEFPPIFEFDFGNKSFGDIASSLWFRTWGIFFTFIYSGISLGWKLKETKDRILD